MNTSVTQVEVVTLHGVDHIAGSGAALPNHLRNVCRSDALVVLGLRSLWLKAVSANPVGLANLNLTLGANIHLGCFA